MRWLIFLLAVVACRSGLAMEPATQYNRPSAIFPAGNAVHGRDLAVTCLSCHGATPVSLGTPPVPAPKLLHQRSTSLFYAMHDYRTGQRRSVLMDPLMKALSEQDLRDLAAYIGAVPLGAADRQALKSPSETGRRIAIATCAFCHGERGLTVMDGYEVLAGQYPAYLRQALLDYRSGARLDPTMRAMARGLSDADINAVVAHYASQSGLETWP